MKTIIKLNNEREAFETKMTKALDEATTELETLKGEGKVRLMKV